MISADRANKNLNLIELVNYRNKLVRRLDIRNLKFFKKHSIIAQFKALERILEWAYFLSLDKQFQRYLNFSAPKKIGGGGGGGGGRVCGQEFKGELHT